MKHYDAVVVGAGPYGLSAAAHLRSRGLKTAIFGKTVELWRTHMPKGMWLRSHWWATNLSDSKKEYGFQHFFEESNFTKGYPQPVEAFIQYAHWFQERAVPDLDETYVSRIEREGEHFRLTLADGRQVGADAVVMAIGLFYYAHLPAEYRDLPRAFLSHSSELNDCSRFRGKSVIVVGGGQSALEASALLYENGAAVHSVSRRHIDWLSPDRDGQRSLLERIKAPRTAFSPGWINWAIQHLTPLIPHLPASAKDRLLKPYLTAGVSAWVKDRVVEKVTLHEGCTIAKIETRDGKVKATLSDGTTLTVDHVIMATGYKVDIDRLPMLDSSLRAAIETHDGAPVLNRCFESSVPGLYFVGLSAMRSFGPLLRFVAGCRVASPRVARSTARKARASVRIAPRALAKDTAARVLSLSGVTSVARAALHRNLPFVVYYHRVVDRMNGHDALPAMEISARMLERHVDWLGSNFEIVSLDDFETKLGKRRARPLAMVTFDDGYSDIYHHAFPLLKRKGVPAAIFAITDLVGSSRLPLHEELYAALVAASRRWTSITSGMGQVLRQCNIELSSALPNDVFSATRVLLTSLTHAEVQRIVDFLGDSVSETVRDKLRPLTWEMLAEMRDAGMTIGSHTRSHPLLTNESDERVLHEVKESRLELQRRLGVTAASFAYPGGGFTSNVVQHVASAGYRYGFSICRHTDPQYPLLTIPRTGLWENACLDRRGRFSPAIMSCHSAHAFDWISKCTFAHAAA
jgi:cation diffusion facilitator CzcD-associated flavoprotein CzcO/peptidoglycan/xylan/chitin deacetylase (PgdA/CDA1 family)